jgi:zinc protease
MRRTWFAAAAAVLAVVSFVRAEPLPTDPRLVTGELDNGLKYIVMQHGNPPGRAAVWLHVSTGSLNETDEQRGIAHYLEHMAFNGSENFPPGSVITFFESMGLRFGQHQNAFTSFDQTVYQLAMPDNKPETLDKALLFMSDVAGRLLLLPDEIENERQVILEERRSRMSGRQRVQDQVIARLIPGSLIGERLPIGVEETILGVDQDDFRDYYTRWYVPSNMTLVVVADMEPEQAVARVREHFGFGERTPVPVDQDARVAPTEGHSAIVVSDPELTSADITIGRITPPSPPVTTVELARAEIVETIGSMALNRRIEAKVNRGGTSYLGAGASTQNLFNVARFTQVSADGKPERWRDMLTELAADVQRARLHGFEEHEIEDVKTMLLASAERFVEMEKTIPASFLLRQITLTVASGEPVMSPTQTLDLYRRLLPTITAEEVSARFAELYDPSAAVFVLEIPSSAEVPAEADLLSHGLAAIAARPEKEAAARRASALLEKTPTPGDVAEQAEHQASAVWSGWLSNGVRVHHRFMDYREGQVTVTITLADGSLRETAADRGVSQAAGLAWDQPATSTLSSTDIRDLMVGKKVSVGGSGDLDDMRLTVSGSATDLEAGMQLAYLLLTDPRIEASALEQWKERQLRAIEAREKDPRAAFAFHFPDTIFPRGEVRTRPLTASQVERITLEQAQARLDRVIATAPIEVAIVGDISRERAVELARTYLGSLPPRERISDATLDDLRPAGPETGPLARDAEVATQTPTAFVLAGFFGPDADNIADSRRMGLAARIVSSRMIQRIREQERLVYSISAASQPAPALPGFGLFFASAPTDPAKVERLLATIEEMYETFAAEGPTAEELEVAKKQAANTFDEQMKEPGFWTSRLATLTYRGVSLDDIVAAPEAYQNETAEAIRETFAKYYKPESIVSVIVRPVGNEPAPSSTPEAPTASH